MSEQYKRNPNTKCLICGKEIYKRPSEIKSNNGKSCSRSCANIHRAGIKYKINRPRDKVKSYQSLKIRLLRERGTKCERCGYAKFEILQIHHKNRNKIDNNLENLELICPNCHYEEHFLEKSWLTKLELEKLINNS